MFFVSVGTKIIAKTPTRKSSLQNETATIKWRENSDSQKLTYLYIADISTHRNILIIHVSAPPPPPTPPLFQHFALSRNKEKNVGLEEE